MPLAYIATDNGGVGGDPIALLEAVTRFYGAARRLHRIAGRWLDDGPPALRDGIQRVLGDLACWLGWLVVRTPR